MKVINRSKLIRITGFCAGVLSLFWGDLAFAELDPTKPPQAVIDLMPTSASKPVVAWELQGLQENGKKSFVIIGGQIVKIGELYQDYRLQSVSNQSALFVAKSGEKKLLKMNLMSFVSQEHKNNIKK